LPWKRIHSPPKRQSKNAAAAEIRTKVFIMGLHVPGAQSNGMPPTYKKSDKVCESEVSIRRRIHRVTLHHRY
jgi:hypothetical protein